MTEDTQLHTEDLARPTGAPVVTAPLPDTGSEREREGTLGARPPDEDRGSRTQEDPQRSKDGDWEALLGDTTDLSSRWGAIQAGFVDEPRRAVEEADGLVAELIQRLARTFAAERTRLEEQWSRGDQVSTEDLRVSLRTYRTFFNQLLHQSDSGRI